MTWKDDIRKEDLEDKFSEEILEARKLFNKFMRAIPEIDAETNKFIQPEIMEMIINDYLESTTGAKIKFVR